MDGLGQRPVLEATNISKSYDPRVAVRGVTLSVHRGEIVGPLRPNGAGKTTTLSIFSTRFAPTRAKYGSGEGPRRWR